MSEPIVSLVPGKTDAQLAAEYRAEITKAITPLLDIVQRAKDQGLFINWTVGPDNYGKIILKETVIVKPL